jgi:outer membrane protein assembly factor BamD
MKELNKRSYERAIENFNTVVESFSGSAVVDSALFYMAEAHYKNEDYITAVYEYERVYTDYPSSRFVAEAQYKKALCYFQESPKASLDQENTRLAIDEFNRFIDNFPQNTLVEEAQKRIEELQEKLAYKDFLAAEIYRKIKSTESLEAAILYYQGIIDQYPRSVWVDDARFGIGQVYLRQKKYDQAAEVFGQLATADRTDSKIKKKAAREIAKLEKDGKKSR